MASSSATRPARARLLSGRSGGACADLPSEAHEAHDGQLSLGKSFHGVWRCKQVRSRNKKAMLGSMRCCGPTVKLPELSQCSGFPEHGASPARSRLCAFSFLTHQHLLTLGSGSLSCGMPSGHCICSQSTQQTKQAVHAVLMLVFCKNLQILSGCFFPVRTCDRFKHFRLDPGKVPSLCCFSVAQDLQCRPLGLNAGCP